MTTKSTETSNGTAKKRKPAAKKTAASPLEPTREQITMLAEKYWAERGWPDGSPEQDWLRAEEALRTAS